MNLRFLETFIWVARLRSFKAASGKLNITQVAVSGRISALESEFQQIFFKRNNRYISITYSGRNFLYYVDMMINIERSMHSKIKGKHSHNRIMRLRVIESIIYALFPSFISNLQKIYPGVEIEITVESTRRIHALSRRGEIDVALQTDPIVGSEIHNRDLGSLKMGWICSPELGVTNRISLRDLLNWPIVTFTRNSQPHLQLLEIVENAGLMLRRIHFVSSIAAHMSLIEGGVGTAALPLGIVSSELATRHYRHIRYEPSLPNLRLVASWRPDPITKLSEKIVDLSEQEIRSYTIANRQYADPPFPSSEHLAQMAA